MTSMPLDVGLIELVCLQLIAGPCQSFKRPTRPTDSVVSDVPAMAAFAKAALEGGIEHESVQRLYQVTPSLASSQIFSMPALMLMAACVATTLSKLHLL